jgi:hypothetical protein
MKLGDRPNKSPCYIERSSIMRIVTFKASLLVLIFSSAPAFASDVSVSASDAGCKVLSFSGTITLTGCDTVSSSVRVEIYQNGMLISSTGAVPKANAFSGSYTVSAAGTYTVLATVDITSGGCAQPYSYVTSVTIN